MHLVELFFSIMVLFNTIISQLCSESLEHWDAYQTEYGQEPLVYQLKDQTVSISLILRN